MSVPALLRGVRVKQDTVRDMPVLLGPERALMLDPIGAAILDRVDGERDLDGIVVDLAAAYDAPADVIRGDVEAFLSDLADKRLLEMRT
ncbi:pyrroloquinoline quinone biosynthesis peptide chaperone PqqD (plasmid) [Paracoccus sp. TK19116]|uniref:Pyrroloquinoline quinone biosynthesis peptide chaperone PqqD n=1 Tax=Paracoccus albicereus TaxID=2922394 RepID=A0ABT1ML28_9RHOB|nr:pyrroloquinoline quinone biosynthesis peptide chaperone PqqD [Paracoccus albicereus]MCQ0968990.1 pyrroloquinoline quinone biosynthesis peptide chaperone PqqD [Paracoccus albicereus]